MLEQLVGKEKRVLSNCLQKICSGVNLRANINKPNPNVFFQIKFILNICSENTLVIELGVLKM